MVRNINPSAPLIVLLECSENFNLMSNQTPRSRIVSVFSGTEFWTVYLATTGFCFRVMLNYLHLARSSFNFQVSDQSARYLCEIHLQELRIQLRANFVIWFNIFSKKPVFIILFEKSLTNNANRNSETTHPSGIPERTWTKSEHFPLTIMRCLRFSKCDQSQSRVERKFMNPEFLFDTLDRCRIVRRYSKNDISNSQKSPID